MSLPLISGCIWVLLATIVAALPMRRQFVPGFALLIAAPVLLVWIGSTHGIWPLGISLLAFLSMFRKPLRYFLRRAMGENPDIPA